MALKILALTKYGRRAASSRTRFYQLIRELKEKHNICSIDVSPLLSERYVMEIAASQDGVNVHHSWIDIGFSYLRRAAVCFTFPRYEMIWIEKEIFPGCPALLERLAGAFGAKLIVDYDDATNVWYKRHRQGLIRSLLNKKIEAVITSATVVTTGNEHLARFARSVTDQPVHIIKPCIDADKYSPANSNRGGDVFTIGWIGSPSTSPSLDLFMPALKRVAGRSDAKFVTVGACKRPIEGLEYEAHSWSEDTEADHLARWDVGVAPLEEGLWSEGKCGYKVIQYMMAGIPTIASPVGAIKDLIRHGENGFFAESAEDCEQYLVQLRDNPTLRQQMGAKARETALSQHTVSSAAKKLANIFEVAAAKEPFGEQSSGIRALSE